MMPIRLLCSHGGFLNIESDLRLRCKARATLYGFLLAGFRKQTARALEIFHRCAQCDFQEVGEMLNHQVWVDSHGRVGRGPMAVEPRRSHLHARHDLCHRWATFVDVDPENTPRSFSEIVQRQRRLSICLSSKIMNYLWGDALGFLPSDDRTLETETLGMAARRIHKMRNASVYFTHILSRENRRTQYL